MKSLRIKIFAYIFLMIGSIFSLSIKSQVSIGSLTEPSKAAILELKDQVSDTNNVTSKKGGLILPRVKLTNRKTLEPFIPNNSEFQNNVDKVKDNHIGLSVYNLSSNLESETGIDKQFRPGIYIWDGKTWNYQYKELNYFYMPSFDISLANYSVNDVATFNLYEEYVKQFSAKKANGTPNPTFVTSNTEIEFVPSPTFEKLYDVNELDYVVTYYDSSIISDVSVNAQGVLQYKVKSLVTTDDSFLYIVFVVK